MASPHVCGLASLLLADNPSLTPKQVKDTLIGSAHKNVIDLDCLYAIDMVECELTTNFLAYNGC